MSESKDIKTAETKQKEEQLQQRLNALGFSVLVEKAKEAAVAIVDWVYASNTGRRGLTAQGKFHASTVVAQVLNGGKPVTVGHIASTFLILGGVAPGRSNDKGYGARKNFTVWHSAAWGAGRFAGPPLIHGKVTEEGASTWSVPTPILKRVTELIKPEVVKELAELAQANLSSAVEEPCGCKSKKSSCATPARTADGKFSVLS